MSSDPRNLALVRSIVDIGHNYDLLVVAEGVQDESMADTLRDLGCDVLQGRLFGERCSAREVVERFAADRNL